MPLQNAIAMLPKDAAAWGKRLQFEFLPAASPHLA
jgi:hypothetical protein